MALAVSMMMVLLFVSASIMLDGWLGKHRNSHPHCRACGYDLVGSFEASSMCPECGASIDRDESVRWGASDRNWIRFAIGAATFLASIFGLIVALSR